MEIKHVQRGLLLELTLRLPRGLHARPSAKLAQLAKSYCSDIMILCENGEADAKSMLDVLSLALKKDDKIVLLANGEDARDALTRIAEFCLDSREHYGANNT